MADCKYVRCCYCFNVWFRVSPDCIGGTVPLCNSVQWFREHQGADATTDTSSKINYDRRDDATCQLHRDYDGTEHSGDRMSRDCASL